MRQINIKTILFIAGLTVSSMATAGKGGFPTPLPPMIVKTAVDIQEKALIITGRNFGATMPTVMLADQALDVKHFSEHEIVANLPRGLAAATYGVIVTTTGQNRASSNLFSATLPSSKKTGL